MSGFIFMATGVSQPTPDTIKIIYNISLSGQIIVSDYMITQMVPAGTLNLSGTAMTPAQRQAAFVSGVIQTAQNRVNAAIAGMVDYSVIQQLVLSGQFHYP